MKIYIDQSGKIEETQRDTVLAYVAHIGKKKEFGSIKITAKTKRRLQDRFRQIGHPKDFVIATFSTACFLLLKSELKKNPDITIDIEYPGKEKLITIIFQTACSQNNFDRVMLSFALLGKLSLAHNRAIKTFHKQYKADRILTFAILDKEIFWTQNGRPVLKYQVTMTSDKSAPLRPNLQ